MSLRRRPIDAFKLISIHDDAVDGLPDKAMKEYEAAERDFATIAPHIEKLEDKPVVFTCDPLRPAYDSIGLTGNVADLKAVFCAHVRAMDNVGEGNAIKLIDKGDRLYVDQGYCDSLPLAMVIDIASEIIRRGIGDTSPFSLPVSFWRTRAARSVRRHAIDLSTIAPTTETAKSPGDST
jgi:hypothetical protein